MNISTEHNEHYIRPLALKELIYLIEYWFSSRAFLQYGSERQQIFYIDILHNS